MGMAVDNTGKQEVGKPEQGMTGTVGEGAVHQSKLKGSPLVPEVEWEWNSPSAAQVQAEPHVPKVCLTELEVEGLLDKVATKIKVVLSAGGKWVVQLQSWVKHGAKSVLAPLSDPGGCQACTVPT
jgi:hypothetical protein